MNLSHVDDGPCVFNVFNRGRTPNWRHRNRMNLGDGPCLFKRGRTPNLRHRNCSNVDDGPCVFNVFKRGRTPNWKIE